MIYLHPTWHPSLAVQLACTLWLIKTCLLLIHFPNSNNFKDLLAKIIPILISLKKACVFQGVVNGILFGAIELRWNFFRKKHHFLCLTFDWQASQQISVERDLSMRGKDRGVFPALWQRPTYSFWKSVTHAMFDLCAKGAWCNKALYPPPMNTIAVIAILSTPYILITYKFLGVKHDLSHSDGPSGNIPPRVMVQNKTPITSNIRQWD